MTRLEDGMKKIQKYFGEEKVSFWVKPYTKRGTGEIYMKEYQLKFRISVNEKFNYTQIIEDITIQISPRKSYEEEKEEALQTCDKYLKKIKAKLNKIVDLVTYTNISDTTLTNFLDPDYSFNYKPYNRFEKSLFEKMPLWARRYVKQIVYSRGSFYKYIVGLQARLNNLDGDAKTVYIDGNTSEEINEKLEWYKLGYPSEKRMGLQFIVNRIPKRFNYNKESNYEET